MKKLLLMFALTVSTLCASAETYTTMRFVTSEQTEHLINLEGLEISIADGFLTATNGTETLTLPVANLATMEFSSKQSGIVAIEQASQTSPVTVYGTDGKLIGIYINTAVASATLPAGTYIIKAESGQTSKLTLRK